MVIKNDDCTGCMVCMDVCPKRCIMRIQDDKGFFYPRVETEKCIHCKKCDKVCPVENKNDILIICSDGLTNMVREEKIFDIVKENNSDDVTDVLIDEANNAGGLDNITVIVIDNR